MAKHKPIKMLSADLYRIGENVQSTALLSQAASIVQQAAQAKARGRYTTGELANSIGITIDQQEYGTVAHIGTNKEYAIYVELGTGPKGQASHEGISPDVTPTYRQTPWWIHESQVNPKAAETYKWFYIDTKDGRFYKVTGQPARPFLYPAINNNRARIEKALNGSFEQAVSKATK